MRRPFRTTENTENTEKENTRDAVKAEEEITHGDRQDQEIATQGSRLRAGTLGSRPSLLVSQVSSQRRMLAVRHRKLDAPTVFSDLSPCSPSRRLCAPIVKTGNNHGKHGGTQKWKHIRISFPCCSVFSVVKNLSAARPRCDLCGSIPPVLSPGRSQLENLHRGHRSTDRSQPPQCPEEHRAENREGKGPRQAQRHQTRVDRRDHHVRPAPGRPRRVIDDSTNDKIGILSHEGMDATDRPYQGACDWQSLPTGVKMRENVQNEAASSQTASLPA